jgi:5S rRNA maturation endonuclease (ribonuclease M5)
MNYTNEELAYILYNNRSVKGVVRNFLPKDIDTKILLEVEKKLNWVKKIYNNFERFIEIDKSKLNLVAEDYKLESDDISGLSTQIFNNVGKFSNTESQFLKSRGITEDIINQYSLSGVSFIQDHDILNKLNFSLHPLLNTFLDPNYPKEGIIIPLFEGDILKNCAIRKISSVGKLKYSLAIPDIDVWGLENEKNEVWICEGLFDMMALKSIGLKVVSVSSAMWSSIQLYRLLESKPSSINILCDNDQVGWKTGAILSKFFNLYGIRNQTWHCKSGKDAAEIIFEKKLDFSDIEPLSITKEMLSFQDSSFNFLQYLVNREF